LTAEFEGQHELDISHIMWKKTSLDWENWTDTGNSSLYAAEDTSKI